MEGQKHLPKKKARRSSRSFRGTTEPKKHTGKLLPKDNMPFWSSKADSTGTPVRKADRIFSRRSLRVVNRSLCRNTLKMAGDAKEKHGKFSIKRAGAKDATQLSSRIGPAFKRAATANSSFLSTEGFMDDKEKDHGRDEKRNTPTIAGVSTAIPSMKNNFHPD